MLSQKLSKEMMIYDASPTAKNLEQLERTATVFSRTQKALRFGGESTFNFFLGSTVPIGMGGGDSPTPGVANSPVKGRSGPLCDG